MDNKISRSELFGLEIILLYGNFAATKYILTMGSFAFFSLICLIVCEFVFISIASFIPPIKSSLFGFALSLLPLFAISILTFDEAKSLQKGDYSYVNIWIIVLTSLLFCIYLSLKGIAFVGRSAIIFSMIGGVCVVILLAVYVKTLNFSRLISGYKNYDGFYKVLFSFIPELILIYLCKSFFYLEKPNRITNAPAEKSLTRKELNVVFFKSSTKAWAVSSVLRLAVTFCLLSLADSRIYALSPDMSIFAARLLKSTTLSPVISAGIYMLTLLRFCTALCVLITFFKSGLCCKKLNYEKS